MSILTSFAVSLAAVLLQSAPFVILGYLAAALLREFLGAETLRGRFGAVRDTSCIVGYFRHSG